MTTNGQDVVVSQPSRSPSVARTWGGADGAAWVIRSVGWLVVPWWLAVLQPRSGFPRLRRRRLGWFWTTEQTTDSEERTGILVAVPDVVVGFDLTRSVRIAATAGHRWVWGVEGDIPNRSHGDAGGSAFGVQLSMRR